MNERKHGRTYRLSNRLLLTHMVVAIVVLIVAALILLAIQAPMRSEFTLQRMSEWLAPTIMAVRTGNIDLLRNDTAGLDPTERFLTFLRNQAEAQDARAPGEQSNLQNSVRHRRNHGRWRLAAAFCPGDRPAPHPNALRDDDAPPDRRAARHGRDRHAAVGVRLRTADCLTYG